MRGEIPGKESMYTTATKMDYLLPGGLMSESAGIIGRTVAGAMAPITTRGEMKAETVTGVRPEVMPAVGILPSLALEPVAEPVETTEPVMFPILSPITEPITQPITQPITEPILQPIVEPIIEPVIKPKARLVPGIEITPYPVPPRILPPLPFGGGGDEVKKKPEEPLKYYHTVTKKEAMSILSPDLFSAAVSQVVFGSATAPRFKGAKMEELRRGGYMRVPTAEAVRAPEEFSAGKVIGDLLGRGRR
jgi:hypothetical protein